MSNEQIRREAAEKLRRQTDQERLAETAVWMMQGGHSPERIVDFLVESGVEPEEAAAFARDLFREAEAAVKAEASGVGAIVSGIALLALGGGITAATYYWAPGGFYVVSWGLMAVGAWSLLSGLAKRFSR